MIALTRAVNTLIVTVSDPTAPVLEPLRAAAALLPAGIVEWTTGSDCAALFQELEHPHTSRSRSSVMKR